MPRMIKKCRATRLLFVPAMLAVFTAANTHGQAIANTPDPLMELFIKKGFVTQEEADRVKAEADNIRTNGQATVYSNPSKWKIDEGTKQVELFGDIRLRYEDREATDPKGNTIALDRLRYAVRFGLRGEVFDDFYYGLRLETSSNPRSTWVTMGTSSSGTPYYGPFGKSTAGINIGQAYIGWHPEDWLDITLGKMPNPLYTTSMVWSSSLNPEGAGEHFKYTVGEADLFANFGQFLYQDTNPSDYSQGYFNPGSINSGSLPFLLAWQGGANYHITKKVSFKIAPDIYYYTSLNKGVNPSNATTVNNTPGFSGTYVGQGSLTGLNGHPAYYNYPTSTTGFGGFDGFAANQTGINDLLVLEIPFELNVKLSKVDLRFFGDYAYNLNGADRARAAYNAADSTFFASGAGYTIASISAPQIHDDKAYQFGVAIGSSDSLGLVSGITAKKHSWEFRTYWQHVEQYALDPNLVDTDFFEGVENLQGIYAALAYSPFANVIATIRYGYADRINSKLGIGGSGLDIPQMNPINHYDLLQLDLGIKF